MCPFKEGWETTRRSLEFWPDIRMPHTRLLPSGWRIMEVFSEIECMLIWDHFSYHEALPSIVMNFLAVGK